MMIMLACLAALYAAGAVVATYGVQTAHEAFEDESGFHLVWQNNRPDAANVACVWKTRRLATA